MTNRAEAAAVPGIFTLDGVEYRMSPLTDEIIGRLDNWLRTSIICMGRIASRGQGASDRDAIMSAAFMTARRMSWFTEGDAASRTVAGNARYIFEVCREYHPDITVKQIEEAIRDDPDGLHGVWDITKLLNPGRSAKKKATTTETTDSSPAKTTSTESSVPATDGQPEPSPG